MDETNTLTSFNKISEKEYLTMDVRKLSRQCTDKISGQVVWKPCYCPENWPFKNEDWKNPTSTPKDDLVLLRKKHKFLRENVPQDKFSEFQKCCFKLYENEQWDELSDLVNLQKIREQLMGMDRFMSRVNCSPPLVHSKVMEVKTLMSQLCSNESVHDASLKRKSSTATPEPVKKKSRDSSPSLPPSTEHTLSCPHLRYILPKRTSSKTDPQNHTTAKPSNTENLLADHLDAATCTVGPKYCFSDQDYQEPTFSTSNCPASQPETNESTGLADQDHQGITLSPPNSPSDENRTDIADQQVLPLSTSKYCLSVQDDPEFTSSSPDLLASAPNVNRTTVSADHPAGTSSTPSGCLSLQVHQEIAPSYQPDESDQFVRSENEGLFDTLSPVKPSLSVDSGRSSLDTLSDQEDHHTDSPQDNLSQDWILDKNIHNSPQDNLFRDRILEQTIHNWLKDPENQALFEELSALLDNTQEKLD